MDSQRRRGGRAFRCLVVVRAEGRARGRDARLERARAIGTDAVVVGGVVVAVVVDGTDGVAVRTNSSLAAAFSNVVPRALESTVGGDVG